MSSTTSIIQKKSVGGINEGIARALSQACVYPIETRKTLTQVYGVAHQQLRLRIPITTWINGLSTSCITAGIVFCTYFSIYNNLTPSPFATSAASFMTSFIKLPFGNSMRLMQCGTSKNIIHAGSRLCEKEGVRGLYNGYGLCLVEDAIDMDIRLRLYNGMINIYHNKKTKTINKSKKQSVPSQISSPSPSPIISTIFGATAGAISCGITTPFDTVRAKMCFNTAKNCTVLDRNAIHIGKMILLQEGLAGFWQGASLRLASNAVKSGLFFCFLNILENTAVSAASVAD